jgi:hypothetical protein
MAVATPAEKAALGRDVDGSPTSGQVNYASVIGMLFYLCHSHPDIAFATHQWACYIFAPKQLHEDALKCIGRGLKGTLDKGLILHPSDDLKIDCYPDADFAGLWNHDDKNDPHCVQSWTGYVICVSNFPVLWTSKLQTEIVLSTMVAEYVALSSLCRDLFPLIDITQEICSALLLHPPDTAQMHIKIHDDNAGTLILGQLEPQRMTPCSKHYSVKYHWFREHLVPRKFKWSKLPPKINLVISLLKALIKLLSNICERCSWVGRSQSALSRGSIAGIYLPRMPAHVIF